MLRKILVLHKLLSNSDNLDVSLREVNFHLANHSSFTNKIDQSELVTMCCTPRQARENVALHSLYSPFML